MRIRVLLSITVAALCAYISYQSHTPPPQQGRDATDAFWATQAAAELLQGHNPYAHPAHADRIPYPLPAAILVMPVAGLPRPWQAALFAFTTTGILVFMMMRDGSYWRLLILLSPSLWSAIVNVQWSPLLLALAYASTQSPLMMMSAVKPHTALPIILSRRISAQGLLFPACLTLISLLIMPNWPWYWIAQLGTYRGFIPMLVLPIGPLLLLALLRWRTQRGRFLLLLSAVPQYPLFYDQLLVSYCAHGPRNALILVICGWIGLFLSAATPTNTPLWLTLSLYLPALVIVLSSRPLETTND